MGVDGEDGKGPRHFSVQGREEDNREAAATTEGRELVLPDVGGSNEVDRDSWDTDINPPEAEYGREIHCNATDSGHVRTGHPAARQTGVLAVVVTDGDILEGSAGEGGGSSGGTGNGVGFGFGVRGRTRRGRGRNRGGGVPGRERVQWSGVERSGAEWSRV